MLNILASIAKQSLESMQKYDNSQNSTSTLTRIVELKDFQRVA